MVYKLSEDVLDGPCGGLFTFSVTSKAALSIFFPLLEPDIGFYQGRGNVRTCAINGQWGLMGINGD